MQKNTKDSEVFNYLLHKNMTKENNQIKKQ